MSLIFAEKEFNKEQQSKEEKKICAYPFNLRHPHAIPSQIASFLAMMSNFIFHFSLLTIDH